MNIARGRLQASGDRSTPSIVYLHGGRATSTSFNYLRLKLAQAPMPWRDVALDYDSENGFVDNLDAMKQRIEAIDGPLYFVAHSLGGIYALHLAHAFPNRVLGAVTLSTPYGGWSTAKMLRYWIPSALMWDIGPDAAPIVFARHAAISWPWVNVVSTNGQNPLIAEDNDGVVTLGSMRYRASDMTLIDVATNHYEVVQHVDVAEIVRGRVVTALHAVREIA